MKLTLPLPFLASAVLVCRAFGQGAQPEPVRTNGAPAVVQPTVVALQQAPASASESSSTQRRSGRVSWALDLQPAAVLANIAADDFSVRGPNGKETLSLISSVPALTLGADIACLDGYLNLRGGGGLLLNSALGAWMANAQVGYSLEVKRNVMFGPHIGLSYFSEPEWWGDTEITFDDTVGYLIGLHVAAGDRIAYLLTVDYMSMQFDVSGKGPGVTTSSNELDLSGLAVQFGLRVQF